MISTKFRPTDLFTYAYSKVSRVFPLFTLCGAELLRFCCVNRGNQAGGINGQNVTELVEDVSIESRVRLNQVKLLYDQLRGTMLGTACAATFLVIAVFEPSKHTAYLAWLGTMWAVLVSRLVDMRSFNRSVPSNDREVRFWTFRYCTGSVLTAGIWATWPLLFFPQQNFVNRAVGAVVLAGMAGGTFTVLAIIPWLALTYGAALLVPASTTLLLLGVTRAEVSLGILGFAYLGTMSVMVTAAYRGITTTLRLSEVNKRLRREAEIRRQETEELNLQLVAAKLALTAANQQLEDKVLERTAALQREISERKRAEEVLYEAKERAQVTLHSIGDAVITTDAEGRVDYLNPVAEALTGWLAEEARGKQLSRIFRIVEEDSRQPAPNPVLRCQKEGKIQGLANHSVLINRYGREYAIEDSAAPIRGREGTVLGAVLVFHDITETRRLARQMAYDAAYDALTGLLNRREFERRLERALASAQQSGVHHALCYLDLDQFKVINDTVGHAAGDQLLGQIKGLLSGTFRERDTFARLGGDEFGLLLENCPLDYATRIAQEVINNIHSHRFLWEGQSFQVGVSIGLVPVTAELESTAQLLSQADVACYTAKELGRNRVHIYQPEDSDLGQCHGEILRAAKLRDTIDQERFCLYCQPILSLGSGVAAPKRYELLLRLLDEGGELVPPGAFIPAAERYGLMEAIDRWVIRTAFRTYPKRFGSTGEQIAINLSGNSLNDESLLGFLHEQFEVSAIPPDRVCFEITETATIRNLAKASEFMKAVKRLGSQLALDDFGSGLSSFRYLKTLPVDFLKIDGSFVEAINENANNAAIVAAINQLAHTLGIQTIAEYASSLAIIGRLQALGVDYAQGYALGPPVPLAEMP